MSPCLLDTNVWIEYLRGRSQQLRERVLAHRPREIRLCSVVVGELYYGAQKSPKGEADLGLVEELVAAFQSHPFDDAAAEVFGRIRQSLDTTGTPIGPYDLQIAAIAIANRLTLVTHNVREFSRVPGLVVEDWQV